MGVASSAREVHVLMNNCYRDHAVDNGAELARLLRGEEAQVDGPAQQQLDIG